VHSPSPQHPIGYDPGKSARTREGWAGMIPDLPHALVAWRGSRICLVDFWSECTVEFRNAPTDACTDVYSGGGGFKCTAHRIRWGIMPKFATPRDKKKRYNGARKKGSRKVSLRARTPSHRPGHYQRRIASPLA
jgi:hypothetical protein